MKRRTELECGFEAGVLWAVAILADTYDQPTMAADLLHESGANPRHADEADRPGVKKALRELRHRKRAAHRLLTGSPC